MILGREASFAVGLGFSILNFWLLIRIVAGLVGGNAVPAWKTGLFFFGKMALLFTIIGLILWKSYASPLPFVTGFSLGLIGGISFMLIKGRVKNA